MGKIIIPKISVLMPVYNCRQFIEESVESIINQTFPDFEFLIIDDCSTDGTYEYLESQTDKRIKLIRKTKNSGLTISLNMGLEIANGEYIARMDGDDISLPDRFAKQVAFMDNNPDVVLCGGGYKVIGSEHKFVPKTSNAEIILDLISLDPIAHPTVFLRNDILKRNGLKYEVNYEPAEDYKMWTILSDFGKLANLKDILIYYRIHQNQISTLNSNLQKELGEIIAFEYIQKLCKGNEYANFFYNAKLKMVKDLEKYETVESEIKNTLKEKGVVTNNEFFLERKRKYLKHSLIRNRYSIPQAVKDYKLLVRSRLILGSNFLLRYIVKSLIFFRSSAEAI